MGHSRDYSEEVASIVDEEVRKLIEAAHEEAWEILVDNREVLDSLVLALLEKETLDKAAVAEIFGPVRKRPARPAWTGSAKRTPHRGPVLTPKEVDLARNGKSPNGQSNGEHSMGLPAPTDVPDSPLPNEG
jgi:cell division protease FtsH